MVPQNSANWYSNMAPFCDWQHLIEQFKSYIICVEEKQKHEKCREKNLQTRLYKKINSSDFGWSHFILNIHEMKGERKQK